MEDRDRKIRVMLKGGGEQASGVAYRLFKSGFKVVIGEITKPTMVRRTVSFANCVYKGEYTIEGVRSVHVDTWKKLLNTLNIGAIPVFHVEHWTTFKDKFNPDVIIDGRMMKRENDTNKKEAPVVIGIGPGFEATKDVDAVIESNRGHYLGRTIYDGSTMAFTGVPGEVMGYKKERVIYSPCEGVFESNKKIGDMINASEEFGRINDTPVKTKIGGLIRGQICQGINVKKGAKIGDVDPRKDKDYCQKISSKSLAIAGGVLEGILHLIK